MALLTYPYQYKGEITIEQVLAEIRKPNRIFWLAFCQSSGKERGVLKIVSRTKYGPPPLPPTIGRIGVRPSELVKRNVPLFTDTGQLPCHNADTHKFFTPLISHIEGFDLLRVIHSNKNTYEGDK